MAAGRVDNTSSTAWQATVVASLTADYSPQPSGWLGGDACASLVLNSTHLLVVFGDTFYGNSSPRHRNISEMVHGSIALVERRRGATPQFFARRAINGQEEELDENGFFQPEGNSTAHGGLYYWVVNGVHVGADEEGEEVLVLLAMAVAPHGNINITGTHVVIVRPSAGQPPSAWPYRTSRVPASSSEVDFSTAVLSEGSWVYLLGGRRASSLRAPGSGLRAPLTPSEQFLARVPRATMVAKGAPDWTSMELWSGRDGWVRSQDVWRAATLFSADYTEGSFGWLPCLGFYFVGLQAYQPAVRLFTSSGPSLLGPWMSEELYRLPALPVNATMAYAAKSHPQMLNELLATSQREDGLQSPLAIRPITVASTFATQRWLGTTTGTSLKAVTRAGTGVVRRRGDWRSGSQSQSSPGSADGDACSLLISYNTNGPADWRRYMNFTTEVYHPIFVRLDRVGWVR